MRGAFIEMRRSTDYSMSTLAALSSFSGSDGKTPTGAPIADAKGNLFAIAGAGGANGDGAIVEFVNIGSVSSPSYASSPTLLASFNGADGQTPVGGLVMDGSGNLFGVTSAGGGAGAGAIFELANTGTATAPTYTASPTLLASFGAVGGQTPSGALIADANGNLFGVTSAGGAAGAGAIFELANTGTALAPSYAAAPTTLASFDGANGRAPSGALYMDAKGDLFGVASAGGANDAGAIFELANTGTLATPSYDGAPTLLASFGAAAGSAPLAGLIADANGNLFGVASAGGAHDDGAIFELVNTASAFAPAYAASTITLYDFDGAKGKTPSGALIVDANGDLFGATRAGGANDDGVVFELKNTGGVATPIYNPASIVTQDLDATTGANALGALLADGKGRLLGLASAGGANSDGALFSATTATAAPSNALNAEILWVIAAFQHGLSGWAALWTQSWLASRVAATPNDASTFVYASAPQSSASAASPTPSATDTSLNALLSAASTNSG
jgi:uncharacterized repeat protein (TIGR03803 family)